MSVATDAEQRTLTPTAGRVLRRSLFWVGVAVFVLVILAIVVGTAGTQAGGATLDSANAAPTGARAVAEVLRQQGVRVTATATLEQTEQAIDDPAATTLFLYDEGLYLSREQLRRAVQLADTVVIADASFDELRAVAPELALAGYVTGPLTADCELTAVQKAGTVSVSDSDSGYRVTGDDEDVTACLGSGDRVYSLVQLDRGERRLVVLGAASALTNEHVVEKGDAALALNLLGEQPNLVWYLPSAGDLPASATPDLGALTPLWVTPALALLILAFVAATVWRGRRFGPLVIENLPVTVRASETMLGRARLYQKSSARLRAVDALRIGSLNRLARLCGLPRSASVDEIAASVASITGRDLAGIRRILVDAVPTTDAHLVALSDDLLYLEHDVAAAARP